MLTSRQNARRHKSNYYKKENEKKIEKEIFGLEKRSKMDQISLFNKNFNSKTCFKNVLTEFLLDQHKKVPTNRQIGDFKPYFDL